MLAALLLAILPVHLDPAPPFPRIAFDAPTIERVAPGVEYGEYDLITSAGPIVVHVVAVAPQAPQIELNTVLASDALQSSGETVSSMARRTGAIAGINADYFDMGGHQSSNQPRRAARSARKYANEALCARDQQQRYPANHRDDLCGNVATADKTVALDAVNRACERRNIAADAGLRLRRTT